MTTKIPLSSTAPGHNVVYLDNNKLVYQVDPTDHLIFVKSYKSINDFDLKKKLKYINNCSDLTFISETQKFFTWSFNIKIPYQFWIFVVNKNINTNKKNLSYPSLYFSSHSFQEKEQGKICKGWVPHVETNGSICWDSFYDHGRETNLKKYLLERYSSFWSSTFLSHHYHYRSLPNLHLDYLNDLYLCFHKNYINSTKLDITNPEHKVYNHDSSNRRKLVLSQSFSLGNNLKQQYKLLSDNFRK